MGPGQPLYYVGANYPTKRLLGEFKLVNLVSLIPSLRITRNHS